MVGFFYEEGSCRFSLLEPRTQVLWVTLWMTGETQGNPKMESWLNGNMDQNLRSISRSFHPHVGPKTQSSCPRKRTPPHPDPATRCSRACTRCTAPPHCQPCGPRAPPGNRKFPPQKKRRTYVAGQNPWEGFRCTKTVLGSHFGGFSANSPI